MPVESVPQVYIILVNWNGTEDTVECLGALSHLDYPRYSVLLIDNGSDTPCTGRISASFPDVEVIESAWNRGFAGANNLGIRTALDRGADYVWLLNNDTAVKPEALSELVRVAESVPHCGIVGSKVLFHESGDVIDFAGGVIHHTRGYTDHRGSGEVDRGQYDGVQEVDYVSGCSLLAKSATIREVGLLEESYFMYWEDTDWCVRTARGGWQVLYAPRSVVYHKKSRGLGRSSPTQVYYLARNALIFTALHHARWLLPMLLHWWPRYYVFGPVVLAGRWRHAAAALQALGDFLLRRTGPRHGGTAPSSGERPATPEPQGSDIAPAVDRDAQI